MKIKEIAVDKKSLFESVFERSHKLNVSLKQAYYGVLSEVQKEFPNYNPYSGYESFKTAFYRKQNK